MAPIVVEHLHIQVTAKAKAKYYGLGLVERVVLDHGQLDVEMRTSHWSTVHLDSSCTLQLSPHERREGNRDRIAGVVPSRRGAASGQNCTCIA